MGRVTLDRELAEQEGTLNGALSFLRAVSGPVVVQWVDSFGRVAGEEPVRLSSSGVSGVFSFNMRAGLTYVNWIRVMVKGVPQAAGAKFMLSPTYTPWDDYHTISWAHYPDGFYDQLRAAGLDAIIAYTKENNGPVLDNNFRFYVEQMAWEVFANYHKDQEEWRALLTRAAHNRTNMDLWVRTPCVNDPKTIEYLRENLTRYVRQHRAFRPLCYNIADELGQGDQISPNDFCHSPYCSKKFAEHLQQQGSFPQWDATHRYARPDWDKADTILANTTTDRAFEAIALGGIRQKYKTIGQFNQEWGTGFPVPRGNGVMGDSWNPILAVARESLSAPELTPAALEKQMGTLGQANARWGGLGSWNAPNRPTTFKNWDEVIAFLQRFYKELGEVTSTRGWNVSAWCDFRNFMDATYADAVKKAGDICKAEDPHAVCATEGAQVPAAFGWYNYEQVVRAVDAIEVYNRGNNVEVIRSLKPSVIMFSTHRYSTLPGMKLDAGGRLRQNWAIRPIWWGVFHNHNAALIWDNNEVENRFVDPATGKLTLSAETFSPMFHELRGGLGKLVINSRRLQDGIAIHYSQASIQIHWLLENLKNARDWMHKGGERSDSLCSAVRNSWTKLIEDLGAQYNFVGKSQIESGGLNSGEYKLFILPESIAVSEQEAEQIRAFVRAGGTVIADTRCGDLDARGRDMRKGLLDDAFGISRGPAGNPAQSLEGIGDEGPLQLSGKKLRGLRVGDATIQVTTGKALARSGDVPLVIVNQLGSGRAIFLNMETANYGYLRLKADASPSLPDIMEGVFQLAGVAPRVRVLGEDGKRLPGTEVVRYANGDCEQIAIFRNPQYDNAGWGIYPKEKFTPIVNSPLIDDVEDAIDNSLLEKEEEVTIEWTEDCQTYDVRGRKYLGKIRSFKATLNPWEPLVYTCAPYPLPPLRVAMGSGTRAGDTAEVSVTSDSFGPTGGARVVHLEFQTPTGASYELYARNLLVKTLPHVERIPFAFNDPKGKWKVTAHDLMTGQSVETAFALS